MWRRQKYLAALLAGIVVSLANGAPELRINGLDATVPLKIEGKENLIISVSGAGDVEEKSYSVICEDRGSVEPLSGPNEVNAGGATAYRFVFDDDGEFGTVLLVTGQNMVIDGISVTAGTEVYKLFLFYSLQADASSVIGIDFEGLSWVAPEPQAEQAAEPEESTSDSEVQLPLVYEPAALIERPREQAEQVLLESPGIADETVCMLRGSYEGLSLAGKDGVITERTNWLRAGDMPEGTRSTIEVSSDITSNQIWTGGNTYHVTADANVQALLVIEPGAIVEFAADKAMFVNNGGTLISAGRPGNPVVYTSDSAEPGYADYYCPIYIEPTASSNTKIMYSHIEYAYAGVIVVDNRLDADICDNYFYNNAYGIVEFGPRHTDIRNNLVFGSYYSGIEVFLGDPNGQGSAESDISIENNTCDYYQDVGIIVHGVAEAGDAGLAVLTNNIVSGSYVYGIAIVNGYMYSIVTNTGYYGNASDKNWAFDEYDAVIETAWPYIEGADWMPMCYLRQDCNFINAGLELIEQTRLIGKTTDVDKLPDYNYVDIGFHYPAWDFSNPGSGESLSFDLDDDLDVDFEDFAILADGWGTTYDIDDLNAMAEQWLKLADPNIKINTYGDSSDGFIDVGVSDFTSDTQRVFLLIDGKYIGEVYWFEEGEHLPVDISSSGTGMHQFKAVSISNSGRITCSNLKDSAFNCFVSYCFCRDAYDSNEPHYFCAYYSGPNDVSVKIYDEDNSIIWSQIYSGPNLHGFIPSGVTLSGDLDSIVFEEIGTRGTPVSKPLGLKFDPEKVPANIKALIIVPSWWMRNFGDYGVIQAVRGAFGTRSVPYRYLKGSQASYEVLAWFGANRNIKYIYYCDHGGYTTDEILRTKIKLSDGIAYSVKQSDFAPGQAPSWCEKLPGNLETTANSIWQIGFNQGQLKFVHFDCCFTGRLKLSGGTLMEGESGQQGLFDLPHSDMSWALGMSSSWTQVFQGWWGEVPKSETSKFNHFAIHEWSKLEEGDSLYTALMYAINETDWIPDGPHDNYRLKGQGDLTDLRIE